MQPNKRMQPDFGNRYALASAADARRYVASTQMTSTTLNKGKADVQSRITSGDYMPQTLKAYSCRSRRPS